jgi:hypothetical protein
MARKTVTLKGEAAGAYVRQMYGSSVKGDAADDGYARIATFTYMSVCIGDMVRAKMVLHVLDTMGLEAALHLLPPPPAPPSKKPAWRKKAARQRKGIKQANARYLRRDQLG